MVRKRTPSENQPRRFIWLAGTVVCVFAVAILVAGMIGRDFIHSELKEQKITAPPNSAIPGQPVTDGFKAKRMAEVMERDTLKMTGGAHYAEMPRAVDAQSGQPVPQEQVESALQSGQAKDNPARQIWVTETALTTALQMAYFGELVCLAFIGLGIALLLVGISLLLLTTRR